MWASSDCKTVFIGVDVGAKQDGNDEHLWFRRVYENAADAMVVKADVQRRLNDALSEIREEAYRKGYEDGRGHKTRLTWFNNDWEPIDVGHVE